MEELTSHYTKGFVILFSALILLTWVVMIVCVLVDMWTGVEKAKALGEPVTSILTKDCVCVRIPVFQYLFMRLAGT